MSDPTAPIIPAYPAGTIIDTIPDYPVEGDGGHWAWYEETSYDETTDETTVTTRFPYWRPDPAPSEADIKAGIAREMLAASMASQAALVATLQPLNDAVAKLDPSALRAPDGFEAFGIAFNSETALNAIRVGMADIAEAVQAVAGAVAANASANETSIAATSAVLDAIPDPMVMSALASFVVDVAAESDAIDVESTVAGDDTVAADRS